MLAHGGGEGLFLAGDLTCGIDELVDSWEAVGVASFDGGDAELACVEKREEREHRGGFAGAEDENESGGEFCD